MKRSLSSSVKIVVIPVFLALALMAGEAVSTVQNANLQANEIATHELSEPDDDFDASDKTWWERNVNTSLDVSKLEIMSYDNPDETSEDNIIGKMYVLNRNETDFTGKNITKVSEDNELQLIIQDTKDVIFRNSRLESALYVRSNGRLHGEGNVIVDNCVFPDYNVLGVCIGGMSMRVTNSYFTSQTDAINVDGGLTKPSLIAYNWMDGSGYPPCVEEGEEDDHNDGIQLWREGYVDIYRNRIGGFANACIIIHSCVPPRDEGEGGTAPISHINIKENFFERKHKAPTYYYLYVCELKPIASYDVTEERHEYFERPRYITITDNWFEDKDKHPLFSGAKPVDRAMFVRTEEERDEGVRRQEEDPSVLDFRRDLGYAETAVDARTWIVWNNNRWVADKSEVDPSEDYAPGGMKGWYDLSREREEYPETS